MTTEMLVKSVQRKGDDHPDSYLSVRINMSSETVTVHVPDVPSAGGRRATEESRFCGIGGGLRSPKTYTYLAHLFKSISHDGRCFDFHGEGGWVRLLIGRSDSDYYIKTMDPDNAVFAGACVSFPVDHEHYTVMLDLMGVLGQDEVEHPLT